MVFKRLFVPLGVLLLSGCSATSVTTLDTLRYALLGSDDVQVSAEQVQRVPYASAYLQVGDNPRAFVVLAFADPDGSLTWASADNNIFVTKQGRLIKTVGLANDLYRLTSGQPDPLQQLATQAVTQAVTQVVTHVATMGVADKLALAPWHYQGEWTQDYVSGDQLTAHIDQISEQQLTIQDKSYSVWLLEERVEMAHTKQRWHNRYWMDRHTGRIMQSEQQLGPDLPVIKMTILKPYAL